MVFICECGKKYRAPDGTPPTGHPCPACNRPLRPEGTPAPGTDVKVLTQQKKALRDELRVRDRQLRIAHGEIQRLKAENEKLREEIRHVRGGSIPFVTISEAPTVVDRSTEWRPLELPSDRLDVASAPLMEEIADPKEAPHLPSDRVPLFPA